MSKLYKGFLNLSKCNKKDYLKETKNMDLGVWVNIWLNDEPDQYGNMISVSLNQSKEQREAGEKKVYVCNAKPNESKQNTEPQNEDETNTISDTADDLPF